MTIYQQLISEKQQLEKAIALNESRLDTLPEGQLVCTKEQKWYHHLGNQKIYIPKNRQALAEALAAKKYFTRANKDLRRKLQGVTHYLKTNDPDLDEAPKLLAPASKYKSLLTNLFVPSNPVLASWSRAPYNRNTRYPHQLKYETVGGLRVRSKSEAMIVYMLSQYQIPFRYEETLTLSGCAIHPDFTLRHPETGEILYWEHCGRMDQPQYRSSFYHKIQLYMENGILPPSKLILTWEDNENPLSVSEVRHQIETHFGSFDLKMIN